MLRFRRGIGFCLGQRPQRPDTPLHTNFRCPVRVTIWRWCILTAKRSPYLWCGLQYSGISYGIARPGRCDSDPALVAEGAAAGRCADQQRLYDRWRFADKDRGWMVGTSGVGYEANPNEPVNFAFDRSGRLCYAGRQ